MANTIKVGNYGLEADERKALREKIDAVNADAAANWDSSEWRGEMAQELSETIYQGFDHENLLELMAEVENLPENGRSFIKNVKGLRAFWIARGGYIEASTVNTETAEIEKDMIGFHVYEFEDKLRNNFAETQATLVDLGIQRMDAAINQRVLATFQEAVTNVSPYYSSGAGLSLGTLNTAIREVRDATRGGQVVILGRSTMTEQIVDALLGAEHNGAGYLPETNEELLARGVIGNYRGNRIVTLTNFTDDLDLPFFPANELWVVARDASKFAFWGGLRAREWVENEVDYWHYRAHREFGGAVIRPSRLRRIVDNTIDEGDYSDY
jgi:hypothetical protein